MRNFLPSLIRFSSHHHQHKMTTSNPPKLFSSKLTTTSPSTNNNNDRIHILGIGNLGRLYASSLANHPSNPPITLIVSTPQHLTQWETSNGIEITRGSDTHTVKHPFDVEYWAETPPISQYEDEEIAAPQGHIIKNLIIATKASAALPQVIRLRRYLDSSSTVVFTQNGVSQLWPPTAGDVMKEYFNSTTTSSAPNFLACVTTHGVISLGPFKSIHASAGDLKVGPLLLNPEAKEHKHSPPPHSYIMNMLATAPNLNGQIITRQDLWIAQMEKLVVNAIINPITAISHVPNGHLFQDPHSTLSAAIDRLLNETSQVLTALTHNASVQDIFTSCSRSYNDTQPHHLTQRFSPSSLKEMLWRVGDKVKDNRSSMLQDVEAGKPTEIASFNGWIVNTAVHTLGGDGQKSLCVSAHRKLIELVESGTRLDLDELASVLLEI